MPTEVRTHTSGAWPGFEPGTTRTLSEYHTPRPPGRRFSPLRTATIPPAPRLPLPPLLPTLNSQHQHARCPALRHAPHLLLLMLLLLLPPPPPPPPPPLPLLLQPPPDESSTPPPSFALRTLIYQTPRPDCDLGASERSIHNHLC